MKNIINVIKIRYKFYIAGYIISYAVAILNNGTANMHILFPLNVFSLLLGILIGTSFYYASQRMLIVLASLRGLKYVIIVIVITIIVGFIDNWLINTFGFNTAPFMGF